MFFANQDEAGNLYLEGIHRSVRDLFGLPSFLGYAFVLRILEFQKREKLDNQSSNSDLNIENKGLVDKTIKQNMNTEGESGMMTANKEILQGSQNSENEAQITLTTYLKFWRAEIERRTTHTNIYNEDIG